MNNDMLLSPHFKLSELTKSATARKNGIENIPPPEAVENLRALCVNTLEPLHEALGLPIIITSGYRCKVLNHLLVQHSAKSQHMNGQAADFYVGDSHPAAHMGESHPEAQISSSLSHRERLVKAFRTIITDERINFDQLIIYPTFIHVSYVRSGHKNRRKLTKAFGNGSYAALTHAQALALE